MDKLLESHQICGIDCTALIHIGILLCGCILKALEHARLGKCKVKNINDSVEVHITNRQCHGLFGTCNLRAGGSADCIVNIEIILALCGLNVDHQVGGTCRNLILRIGKLYPLTLGSSTLCNAVIVGLTVRALVL